MMIEAEPANDQRAAIVIVVGLDFDRAADFARASDNQPLFQGLCNLSSALPFAGIPFLRLGQVPFEHGPSLGTFVSFTLVQMFICPTLGVVLVDVLLGTCLALPQMSICHHGVFVKHGNGLGSAAFEASLFHGPSF